MKKQFILQVIVFVIAMPMMAQFGYIPEKLSGDMYLRDLNNPTSAVNKGTGPNQLAGVDFDLNGTLFGIKQSTGELYQIDTSNASATLIATIAPTGSQFWSGIACDPTDGTMYICSTDGNTNSYFTVDVTNGATNLIGTNSVDDGVVGIAFDNGGQMYAIYLVGKFYKIDKSDGTATFVGNMTNAARGLTHHGLDFDEANEIMYMVSYNVFTFDNELWTVDLSTGANTLVGSVGLWSGGIAVEPVFNAGFSSDITEVCEGGVVNYTDESTGATSWSWTFEGGTPGTSTVQNPSVTYNTAGTWDVTLEISNGSGTTSITMTDYITVNAIPGQASTPAGPDEVCGGESVDYTTTAVTGADSYEWSVDPADAGNFTGTGTTGILNTSATWSGAYTVSVRAVNDCGDGAWSNTFAATLFDSPEAFFLSGGGSYCEGGAGLEITLDGSESGIDYELYLNGSATGNIVAGTGSPISFGFVTSGGSYSAYGNNSNCSTLMSGQPFVAVLSLPGLATVPQGPGNVCQADTSEYTSVSQDAESLNWMLAPQEAGELIPGNQMVEVVWNTGFSGSATLSVYGSNDCGDGDTSELSINVNEMPAPEVSGTDLVCEGDLADYQTDENAGSSYTWEVTGGTITSGAGTHMITVEWGSPGTGSVTVTEDNGDCQGTSASFSVTIDDCVGIGEPEQHSIMIYPNPARNSLSILMPGEDKVSVRIVNMVGQVVLEKDAIELQSGNTRLNIEALEEGVYFIHIINPKGKNLVGRFIKAS